MRFGRCRVDAKRGFAFVDFVDHRDAEAAFRALDGATIESQRIHIEWSKRHRAAVAKNVQKGSDVDYLDDRKRELPRSDDDCDDVAGKTREAGTRERMESPDDDRDKKPVFDRRRERGKDFVEERHGRPVRGDFTDHRYRDRDNESPPGREKFRNDKSADILAEHTEDRVAHVKPRHNIEGDDDIDIPQVRDSKGYGRSRDLRAEERDEVDVDSEHEHDRVTKENQILSPNADIAKGRERDYVRSGRRSSRSKRHEEENDNDYREDRYSGRRSRRDDFDDYDRSYDRDLSNRDESHRLKDLGKERDLHHGRHADRHGDRVVDQHSDRYLDRYGDRYDDKYEEKYSDRYGDRYDDRHGDRYGDRHGDRYDDRLEYRSHSRYEDRHDGRYDDTYDRRYDDRYHYDRLRPRDYDRDSHDRRHSSGYSETRPDRDYREHDYYGGYERSRHRVSRELAIGESNLLDRVSGEKRSRKRGSRDRSARERRRRREKREREAEKRRRNRVDVSGKDDAGKSEEAGRGDRDDDSPSLQKDSHLSRSPSPEPQRRKLEEGRFASSRGGTESEQVDAIGTESVDRGGNGFERRSPSDDDNENMSPIDDYGAEDATTTQADQTLAFPSSRTADRDVKFDGEPNSDIGARESRPEESERVDGGNGPSFDHMEAQISESLQNLTEKIPRNSDESVNHRKGDQGSETPRGNIICTESKVVLAVGSDRKPSSHHSADIAGKSDVASYENDDHAEEPELHGSSTEKHADHIVGSGEDHPHNLHVAKTSDAAFSSGHEAATENGDVFSERDATDHSHMPKDNSNTEAYNHRNKIEFNDRNGIGDNHEYEMTKTSLSPTDYSNAESSIDLLRQDSRENRDSKDGRFDIKARDPEMTEKNDERECSENISAETATGNGNIELTKPHRAELTNLTNAELKEKIKEAGLWDESSMKKLRKQQLVDVLVDESKL